MKKNWKYKTFLSNLNQRKENVCIIPSYVNFIEEIFLLDIRMAKKKGNDVVLFVKFKIQILTEINGMFN